MHRLKMKLAVLISLVICLTIRQVHDYKIQWSKDEYTKARNRLIDTEKQSFTGGNITLNAAEKAVNERLLKWKRKEIDTGHQNGTFIPIMHFFYAKKLIEKSPIFKLIQRMPKGGALHVHDSAFSSMRWLVTNATYYPNCYMCIDKDGLLRFHFFKDYRHSTLNTDCQWTLVVKERAKFSDPAKFDQLLYNNLTLVVDNPHTTYTTQQQVWSRFQSLFFTISDLVFYGPVFRAQFYHSLQEFYDDGVQFIEMRGLFPEVYELDGTVHNTDWIVKSYIDITKEFSKTHPDFIGIRLIYTSSRIVITKDQLLDGLKKSMKYRQMYPDIFAGYDLVGDENIGSSLYELIDDLLLPSQQGIDLPFFFHAGETFWKDYKADLNLIDAILLNTTRIGHGYGIVKHPTVMKLAKEKQIALEICPISNQVLMLVENLCNHPAATLLSQGFPVVISSDDPGIWGAVGLSYDLYETLMGLGGEWADLATLKQLAINSIQYSSLPDNIKSNVYSVWNRKWNEFIREMTRELHLHNDLLL